MIFGMNNRQLFLQHLAQTSESPMALEIVKANGMKQWDIEGNEYLDLIAGISVCNVGHCHPNVVEAVIRQADQYMHIMVYGEFIESPQVLYAKKLAENLPQTLNTVYFTNSGAEAVEGAMKLAKRFTQKSKIIAFNKSYHGSTQGALSLLGDEYWRNAYRPLLPEIYHYNFNDDTVFDAIDEQTACVIMETVQAESGIIKPKKEWINKIRLKCTEHNCLLIFDEIQAGFGRTGSLFAFEKYNIVPDILLLGKALGGGMPLGAFITDKKIMQSLTHNPVLGHITTFGGHPVSCAAGLAAFEVLLDNNIFLQVEEKVRLFVQLLNHEKILNLHHAGLWMAIEFESFEFCKKVIDRCIVNGIITDWFLFAPNCLRIAPPLIITIEEIEISCKKIIQSIQEVCG
jgi:acetylornithine/N-succinyldiaminopimelate aminotransferase